MKLAVAFLLPVITLRKNGRLAASHPKKYSLKHKLAKYHDLSLSQVNYLPKLMICSPLTNHDILLDWSNNC